MASQWKRAAVTVMLGGLALAAGLAACRLPPPAVTPAVGGLAPDFTLPASDGLRFHLGEELGDGPMVLVFYRGHW